MALDGAAHAAQFRQPLLRLGNGALDGRPRLFLHHRGIREHAADAAELVRKNRRPGPRDLPEGLQHEGGRFPPDSGPAATRRTPAPPASRRPAAGPPPAAPGPGEAGISPLSSSWMATAGWASMTSSAMPNRILPVQPLGPVPQRALQRVEDIDHHRRGRTRKHPEKDRADFIEERRGERHGSGNGRGRRLWVPALMAREKWTPFSSSLGVPACRFRSGLRHHGAHGLEQGEIELCITPAAQALHHQLRRGAAGAGREAFHGPGGGLHGAVDEAAFIVLGEDTVSPGPRSTAEGTAVSAGFSRKLRRTACPLAVVNRNTRPGSSTDARLQPARSRSRRRRSGPPCGARARR